MSRGGYRPGSGRKPKPPAPAKPPAKRGRPVTTGRVAVASSITLHPLEWAALDEQRGELTRSRWIAQKIKQGVEP